MDITKWVGVDVTNVIDKGPKKGLKMSNRIGWDNSCRFKIDNA